jgi:hypothetical protein
MQMRTVETLSRENPYNPETIRGLAGGEIDLIWHRNFYEHPE